MAQRSLQGRLEHETIGLSGDLLSTAVPVITRTERRVSVCVDQQRTAGPEECVAVDLCPQLQYCDRHPFHIGAHAPVGGIDIQGPAALHIEAVPQAGRITAIDIAVPCLAGHIDAGGRGLPFQVDLRTVLSTQWGRRIFLAAGDAHGRKQDQAQHYIFWHYAIARLPRSRRRSGRSSYELTSRRPTHMETHCS